MKKKSIFLALGSCFLLMTTGCENDRLITCTLENTKVEITLDKENVEDITAYAEFDNEELAANMCPILKMTVKNADDVSCEGTIATVINYQDSIELEEMTKTRALEYFNEQGYVCKNKKGEVLD